eukprot:15877-Heterococcus_DN1.PRE.1
MVTNLCEYSHPGCALISSRSTQQEDVTIMKQLVVTLCNTAAYVARIHPCQQQYQLSIHRTTSAATMLLRAMAYSACTLAVSALCAVIAVPVRNTALRNGVLLASVYTVSSLYIRLCSAGQSTDLV